MNSSFRAFWLATVTRNIFGCFATEAKMASRFEEFSEDEIWAINETVVQTNTKKATNFSLSVFTGRQKIIFLLNLQENGKNALDKNPEMFLNSQQTFY